MPPAGLPALPSTPSEKGRICPVRKSARRSAAILRSAAVHSVAFDRSISALVPETHPTVATPNSAANRVFTQCDRLQLPAPCKRWRGLSQAPSPSRRRSLTMATASLAISAALGLRPRYFPDQPTGCASGRLQVADLRVQASLLLGGRGACVADELSEPAGVHVECPCPESLDLTRRACPQVNANPIGHTFGGRADSVQKAAPIGRSLTPSSTRNNALACKHGAASAPGGFPANQSESSPMADNSDDPVMQNQNVIQGARGYPARCRTWQSSRGTSRPTPRKAELPPGIPMSDLTIVHGSASTGTLARSLIENCQKL